MECIEIRRRLPQYLDRALGGSDVEEIARHLAVCSECACEIAVIEALNAKAAEALAGPVAAPDLSLAVISRLRAGRPRVRFRWAWGMAVALLAAMLGLWFARPRTQVAVRPHAERRAERNVAEARRSREPKAPRSASVAATERSSGALREQTRRRRAVPVATLRGQGKRVRLAKAQPERRSPLRVDVRTIETPLPASGAERRSATTTVVALDGLAFSRVTRRVVTTLPPNKDAATIDRPPLDTTIKRPGLPGPSDGAGLPKENS